MVRKAENVSVVKIDSRLLERVNKVIEHEENRFRFINKKQFVDIAVLEYLNKIEKEVKNS
jgi:predicted methyltransferase